MATIIAQPQKTVSKKISRKVSTSSSSLNWGGIRKKTLMLSGIERHELIESGLNTSILSDAISTYKIVPRPALLSAIGLSIKTFSRNVDSKLGPKHSGAAMALIEITDAAEKVLGSRELAEDWISHPALALNGKRPLDLLTTTPGIEAVKDLLTRMEFGVYA